MKFYLAGGRAKPHANRLEEWNLFETALVLSLDTDKQACRTLFAYQSPTDACPDSEYSFVFKAGTRQCEKLYLCTQTEVLICELPTARIADHISLPCFNDVHHVLPLRNGNLLVVSTGLDLVVEVALSGDVVNEWGVLGQNVWGKFSREVDYRKVASTKPHSSHPNFAFEWEGYWVTRHFNRDALCLTAPKRRIAIDIEKPHDGEVVGGKAHFTTVDGKIVIADIASQTIECVLDLRDIYKDPQPLGFCRGLKVIDHSTMLVGFSRLRPTRYSENIAWMKNQIAETLNLSRGRFIHPRSTRVACVDIQLMKLHWEVDLEPFGMNAIFSIM